MTIDDFQKELQVALDLLQPQIRGLDDLTRASLSQPAKDIVQQEFGDHTRRRDLIGNVQRAIDALVQDGYPAMPKREVDSTIFNELQVERADILAAFDEFSAVAQATSVGVNLGAPAPKP